MSKVSASIVFYKTKNSLRDKVFQSVVNSKCIDLLYVVDNSPTDENKSFFSNYDFVEYIPNENTGYGSSHNIALRRAMEENFDYHIVLNPDIEFDANVLGELLNYMELNKDVVYVLPKVLYPNGELQYLCKLLPSPKDLFLRRFIHNTKKSQLNDMRYSLQHSGYDKIMNPPCLSGCFMFMRVSTLRDNSLLFDERYFMYLEDFDLIRRLHKYGKTIYYPKVTIIHNHAKGSYENKKLLFIHIKSTIKYFNKWGWFFDKERKAWNKQILTEIQQLAD